MGAPTLRADQPAERCVLQGRCPGPLSWGSSDTCMWWYRSSGASPTELSPSSTTFPASLDACEDREDDEWRPVPIRFTGLGQSGRQAGVRAAAGLPPLTLVSIGGLGTSRTPPAAQGPGPGGPTAGWRSLYLELAAATQSDDISPFLGRSNERDTEVGMDPRSPCYGH